MSVSTDVTSNLYWAQLGIENYEEIREQVGGRVERYLDFLSDAIKSLKERDYKFSGKMSTVLTVAGFGKTEALGTVKLFSDSQYRNPLQFKREHEMDKITVPGLFNGDFFYEKNRQRRFKVMERRILITDLRPVELPEEEENDALDAIFNSSEVSIADKDKYERVRILRANQNRNELEIWEPEEVIQAAVSLIVKYNTYNLWRQGQALETLIKYPQQHFIPLLNLLRHTGTFKWERFEKTAIKDFAVLTENDVSGTGEQRRFVEIALSTKDFAILEGPPGSGKTSTLMEIILKLCKSGKKILMVASTHVAVDNVLERIAESSGLHESLMDRFGVIPLRIGDIERVSENVRRFTVGKRIEEEQKRLKHRLGELKNPTEAQKTLLSALMSDTGQKTIESLVMESANFVCGTTVGILQSDIIEKSKASGRRPFDYMVLDEASKTTFADFIIPALYAEKWIISGDIQQLAPYIEEDFIQAVLTKLPSFGGTNREKTEEIKQISLDVFNAANEDSNKGLRGAVVISDTEDRLENQYKSQMYAISTKLQKESPIQGKQSVFEIPYSRLSDTADKVTRLRLLGSRIVFASSTGVSDSWKLIPPLLALRGEFPNEMMRRERAFLEAQDFGGEPPTWEYEVSWRLNRAFEMRGSEEKSKSYLGQIEFLLPYFLDRPNGRRFQGLSREVMGDVIRVMNMFYPSIIELIQKGLNDRQYWNSEWEAALYEGIPQDDFEVRHVLLTYQHRMHPEISKWARELFYVSKALIDSPELMEGREWNYKRYNRRMIWKDVRPDRRPIQVSRSNFSAIEVKAVEEELRSFLQWTKENSMGIGSPWKIALLTFYRGQEKKLQVMMRSLTGSKNTRYFDIPEMNAEVEVCTVDRFQGQEADVVFMSMVRNRGVGFLDNMNRMNVGITRAKYQMVIIGNKVPFMKCKVDFLNRMAKGIEGPIL